MALTIVKNSGSVQRDDPDEAVEVDDGSDLLVVCAGGCGKKILFFDFPRTTEWGDATEGTLCLECKSRPLRPSTGSL